MLSTVSKVYSSILNSRLSEYLETCGVLCEEQNGFRKGRSCEDHAFVLTNLIQDRIDQRKSTYVSFIDFEKAFDWINRDLLLYKLIMNGIDGKFYFAIKSLYCQTSSCVKLNNILSSSFNTISGVRQGDNLSLLMQQSVKLFFACTLCQLSGNNT